MGAAAVFEENQVAKWIYFPCNYGRTAGVGRGLGVGVDLGVAVGVGVGVAVGVGVGVGVPWSWINSMRPPLPN